VVAVSLGYVFSCSLVVLKGLIGYYEILLKPFIIKLY
jgi:hypothetical protein